MREAAAAALAAAAGRLPDAADQDGVGRIGVGPAVGAGLRRRAAAGDGGAGGGATPELTT